ncbi:Strawberry notch-like protein 1 [Auxenochlorella protothecoides]|uniref:Strawberry notch-like protein 1 n=1 Tax=Auxenochlorella protothecoides TaxID=3075 RepID=A0A087SIF7_AUXPR|nr:Strawberry notch-like protein 1 [Auxenochlorella protothecoides]KFM25511.1 Strawberry notch-like protein 1 [Auxenochlorella protothecoides]
MADPRVQAAFQEHMQRLLNPVVLQIQFLVGKLLVVLADKEYVCPHCSTSQRLDIDLEREKDVRFRATRIVYSSRLEFSRLQAVPGAQERQEKEEDVELEDVGHHAEDGEVFETYQPAKLPYGFPHPDPVVETSSLSAVPPPDVKYSLGAHPELVDAGVLSALQLESVVYACQRHEQLLPDGSRCGFFIGDGAGVGKGRTIAGLILENWRRGRRRHLWLTIGPDLRVDARRDLDDVGATEIPLHSLNKLPYGKLDSKRIGIKEGVVFLTYASLVSQSDKLQSRYKQLVEWCGKDFDGLILFDESHKAKNLVPEAGTRATKVGLQVSNLQAALPLARVVYCSATGASEPRNMGYMVRLGLWGLGGSAFPTFAKFLEAVQGKGTQAANMATLELVAMDMKAQGMYVSRTLSYAGSEFLTVTVPLEEPVASQYADAARMWLELYREFMYAEEQLEALGPTGLAKVDTKKGSGLQDARTLRLRAFWGSHQRFFRYMCMAAKVPAVVRMSKAAVEEGKCIVIGLQSTGEARTNDVVAEKGDELDDFVSGPKELLSRLVTEYYPMPASPALWDQEDESDLGSDEEYHGRSASEGLQRSATEGREMVGRTAKAKPVRYKEFGEDEGVHSETSISEEDSDSEEDGSDSSDVLSSSLSSLMEGEPSQPPSKRPRRSSVSEASVSGKDSGDGKTENTSGEEEEESEESEAEIGLESDSESSKQGVSEEDSKETPEAAAKVLGGVWVFALAGNWGPKRQEQAALAILRREKFAAAHATALERRESILAAVGNLGLPNNPLDVLIDELGGPEKVAEMTGRKGRLVRSKSSRTVTYEARNASGVEKGATLEMINIHERQSFMAGEKLVAIISEAASAGISLHADRRAGNQRRRVHLTLELPWSADKAIQQFGRSHRANQASGPEYKLVVTPLGGEARFAAAVSRRLETLGALTQGDRKAGPGNLGFNYESRAGQQALRTMYSVILQQSHKPDLLPETCREGPDGEPPAVPAEHYLGRLRAYLLAVGILRLGPFRSSGPGKSPAQEEHPLSSAIQNFLASDIGVPRRLGQIEERDRSDVPRFLNRLLGLAPVQQRQLFDMFQAALELHVREQGRAGTLDVGTQTLSATRVRLEPDPVQLFRDEASGATALLHTVHLDRGMSWEAAERMLAAHKGGEDGTSPGAPDPRSPARVDAGAPAVPSGPQRAVSPREQAGARPRQPVAGASPGCRAARAGTGASRRGEDASESPTNAASNGASASAAVHAMGESGYYQSGHPGSKGGVHVMLALRMHGAFPAAFKIVRPTIGRLAQPLALSDLRFKHEPLSAKAARTLWLKAFVAASQASENREALRFRRAHVVTGSVLRCWRPMQDALGKDQDSVRRLRLVRVSTTDDPPERIVGMLVPEQQLEKLMTTMAPGVKLSDAAAHPWAEEAAGEDVSPDDEDEEMARA